MPTYANSEHTSSPHISREQIELRAYEIYLRRGATDGSDVEDWLIAERGLLGQPDTLALDSLQAEEIRGRRAIHALNSDPSN